MAGRCEYRSWSASQSRGRRSRRCPRDSRQRCAICPMAARDRASQRHALHGSRASAHLPARPRPRHHRRARGRVRPGHERRHRRDRRRQVDPGRRARAGARRQARGRSWCAPGAAQAEVEALFDVGDDPERARAARAQLGRRGRRTSWCCGAWSSARAARAPTSTAAWPRPAQLAELARGPVRHLVAARAPHAGRSAHATCSYLDAFAELERARARRCADAYAALAAGARRAARARARRRQPRRARRPAALPDPRDRRARRRRPARRAG